jgi:phenylalanyl-tRNA synthetase alpha chain
MPRSQFVPTYLTTEQLTRDLALRDLTDRRAGPHAIQLLVAMATDALVAAWACPARPCPGPRVVAIADNYDNLGFTAGAASRDACYTHYVDAQRMLRSHSSAMVPAALRALAADPLDDVLLVCPGIVYRRDAIDRLHTGTPHQLDLWRISRRPLTNADMDEMIALLVDALAPGRRWRAEPRVHPYTVDGRQVDVQADQQWVEVWECGLAHPDVLRRAGLAGCHGLALGLGLDRLLMLRKHIPDIRLLRSADPRVVNQMVDLEPHRAVSAMPGVVRDLSVAVHADDDVEQLGDRVRDALGDNAAAVEEVAVLSATGYDDLPASAIARMGMGRRHKNLLVRIVLRHLERTLTDTEANHLRDRIYTALHIGNAHEWASGTDRA